MIVQNAALAVMVLYLLFLFAIARFSDRRKLEGKSIVSNPYIYALSLSVYVSAWTFYGSIGRAASTGLEFLPIYIGPLLAMTLGWVIIRKMIRVSKEHRLTSISDFLSFRYGRSYAIGAVVALLSLIMVTPYVALQLIAISTSLETLAGSHVLLNFSWESTLVVTLLLGIFAVIFGARQLDPMERHEGLIAVVAFESLVKLVAFLAIGLFVAYGIFGGYGDIFSQMAEEAARNPNYAELMDVKYPLWFSLVLISFFAILFLPRQFHVMVVENSDEGHLKKAMWLFPLYLLLINLFVPAIAWGGLLLNTPGLKDNFILTIPHIHNQYLLSMLVFIGGASAATAMILVESVAVGTMLLNNLELPYILRRIKKQKSLANALLNIKRLNIFLVVILGYLYSQVAAYHILADIGIVSFLAASQLAPAALGGLYWKRGNRKGALAGLISGFLLWSYTALIPTISGESRMLSSLILDGAFGLAVLRPTDLFGLGLDLWSNSVFWTLFVNTSLYVLVSLLTTPSPEEAEIANSFLEGGEKRIVESQKLPAMPKSMPYGTIDELETTLAKYIGEERAKQQVDLYLGELGTSRSNINAAQLQELWDQFEKTLTGSLGPSATRMIVEDQVPVKPVVEETKETRPSYELSMGRAYVVPDIAYEVFTDQITHGVEGLCITHFSPNDVRQRWGFKETPIIKLSDEKGSDRYISPRNLPLLFMTIKSFVDSSRNSIVLIDSIEELIEENKGKLPEREMLDFVYQMEMLSRRTRLLLAERQQFVHIELKSSINEAKELIFILGPLSAYLFRVFSEVMLSPLSEGTRREVVMKANELIAAGGFFEVPLRKGGPSDEPGPACEPDMRDALTTFVALNIRPDLVLTRHAFFLALRRLDRIIRSYDPSFDIAAALAEMMKSYGRSPYELSLIPGTTYIIEEEKPKRSLEVFSELVAHGMEGLCLSRHNPETLYERYAIPPETVIWLTQKSEPEYRTVDPTNFPRLSSMLSDFLGRADYPVILLEGMGYLITQSNYETVLRFIQSQRDEIALKNAIMLVHIDPLSLDTKELHRLTSEMEPCELSRPEGRGSPPHR
ncbi:sodium:solute symporter family transporter [Methanothrix sp.]|uniref:sodium:solute symporter family transporter n=1 Tax=Methanothrix sp. TaxID=90426 RepID=UPI003C76B656